MNNSQFRRVRIIITGLIAVFTVMGILFNNFFIPLTAILVSMGILYTTKSRVKAKEVFEDERVYRISEKAARSTVTFFGIGAAFIGILLMTMKTHPLVSLVGETLAFSSSIMLIMYVGFNIYYSKRMS